MNNYLIISDATIDLPLRIVEEYNIKVIPMGVNINDIEYNHFPDEKELPIEDFYNKLKNGAVSQTTQIRPLLFTEYFEEILQNGQDLIYISFSSGLSGTYNTSQIILRDLQEKYPDRLIYSVDSLCASVGEGLLVLNAAIQKKNGMSIDQLKNWLEQNKSHARHWFTVKDLMYLKRGGRLSSIEALIGTALKIKPVLSTDEEGKLVVVSKLRGSRAEFEFLIERLQKEGTDLSSQIVIIGHADDLIQAKKLEELIRSRNLVKEVMISKIGPIIGTHTGPGMLALTFMGEKQE
jgi:DegV family protein with EDD domain